MEITRKSALTGIVRTRNINITEEQYQQWQDGRHIQWVMPNLSADDREFLLTGSTPEEWDEIFGEDE